jgi:hypothetical protein
MVSIAALLLFLIIPVGLSLAALTQTGEEPAPIRVGAKARSKANPRR